jgi:hypothetical protein
MRALVMAPEDVTGEVVEHGVLALAPWRDVDHPGFAPCAVGKDDVGSSIAEHGLELAAHEVGQDLGRDKEGPAGGMPGAAVGGHPAPGHQAMNMRMMAPTPTIP